MASQKKLLDQLLDRFEPQVAAAFRAAMANWRDAMDMAAFIRALSNNDIASAIAALHLDPAALSPFLNAINEAYEATGTVTAAQWPRVRSPETNARFNIMFNGRDPIAEAWLRYNSSELIANITSKQVEAIRVMLTAGLEAGDNPTTTALDIVGRIGQNGKRQGGVIGLSAPQSEYLANAKAELRSVDSELLRNYLNRALRDKRFDGAVERAIESGKKIEAETVTRMLVSYSNRMLKLRGDTIGRSETLPALHAAQEEAVRQGIASGAFRAQDVTKTWRSAHDARVRNSHARMDGQKVAFDRPFLTPDGWQMKYPGDQSMGAPASETIACRCMAVIKVDFLAGVR